MYLHVGGDYCIREKDIIAVLDLENTSVSNITREFLRSCEEEGFVINVSNELPKSYVITETDNKSKVFVSPISTRTLLKRLNKSKGGLKWNR